MNVSRSLSVMECDGVYRPAEDTYLLIKSLDVSPGERVLEIGCGTGVVAMHCADAGAHVVAVDINPLAVDCCRRNAESNGVEIDVRVSDLFERVPEVFDTVVWNLPYLPVDEDDALSMAWSGGEGGVEPLRRLLLSAGEHLYARGRVVIVVSSRMDPEALGSLIEGFKVIELGSERLFFEVLQVLQLRL